METVFEEMVDCVKHGFTPVAYADVCEKCFYDDLSRWGCE